MKKNGSQIKDGSPTSIWLNLNNSSVIELQSFQNYNYTTSDGGYLVTITIRIHLFCLNFG